MRKKFILPVLCALFTACSSPLLEWIETEPDTSTQTDSGPETTPPPETVPGIAPYSMPSSNKAITAFSFGFQDEGETDTIRLSPSSVNGKTPITVILPALSTLPPGTSINSLTPTIQYIGKSISPGSGEVQNFNSPVTYRVTAENGSWWDYEVKVTAKTLTSAELIWFDLELPGVGYMAEGAVDQVAQTVTLHVPSGTNRDSLIAKIVQTGKSFSSSTAIYVTPNTETEITLVDNFSSSVTYRVTAQDNTWKDYIVTVDVDDSHDAGIFDFKVINVPGSVVTIGLKPRADGKYPIIIQVPNETVETTMIAEITLSDPKSISISPWQGSPLTVLGSPPEGRFKDDPIEFGPSSNQEAGYTVTAEDGVTKRDYVVVVSQSPKYYYVDGVSGDDTWPDFYNGGSESYPFKTLAYAVRRAAQDGIKEVHIMGDLDATNGGAPGDSTFDIDLSSVTNKEVIIASSVPGTPRTLSAGSSQRALGITGGADLTFKDINITGGNTTLNGGGIYVAGNSEVDFSGNITGGNTTGDGGGIYVTENSEVDFSGNITGNTARSGGGVYVEAGGAGFSAFTLTSGTISTNIATGKASGEPTVSDMDGGGGVYIKGNANFYLNAGGTISGNITAGAGGGVLVNGNVNGSYDVLPVIDEYGLLMFGGRITSNTSTSSTYPHGGGGVYVAHGYFEMRNGDVTGNAANRQGGGVFVHWGDARFAASGNSTITGNIGTGSSKAICNRGVTEMIDNAQADYVYIWDHGDSQSQRFILTNDVQITTGIALAYSADNKNFIEFALGFMGAGSEIINIDLESHLSSSGNFVGQVEPDWLTKTIITGANSTLSMMLPRLNLNTFTGQPSVYNLYTAYKIAVSSTNGTFEKITP